MIQKYHPAMVARFWSRVLVGTKSKCWEWQGYCNKGYGAIKFEKSRKNARTHVMGYELFFGTVPDGLIVCHRCDNPRCCNPHHLFIGTHKDNSEDAFKKGRLYQIFTDSKGAKNKNAKLTDNDVLQIVSLIKKGKNNQEIANIFGVTHSLIHNIRYKKLWTHIPEVMSLPKYRYGKIVK